MSAIHVPGGPKRPTMHHRRRLSAIGVDGPKGSPRIGLAGTSLPRPGALLRWTPRHPPSCRRVRADSRPDPDISEAIGIISGVLGTFRGPWDTSIRTPVISEVAAALPGLPRPFPQRTPHAADSTGHNRGHPGRRFR